MSENEINSVYIGKKSVMNYVLACITLFQAGDQEICVKARGRAVSRAIGVVEILRRRFMPDLYVKNVKIGAEKISREEGTIPVNVSSIEVIVKK